MIFGKPNTLYSGASGITYLQHVKGAHDMKHRRLNNLLFVTSLWVCSLTGFVLQNSSPIVAEESASIGIYFVKEAMSSEEFLRADLKHLELEEEPMISDHDILAYRASDHAITLTPSAYQRLEKLTIPMSGSPFVVCVGDERIYKGAFWTPLSSASYSGIVIELPAILENDTIVLRQGYPEHRFFKGRDPRNDHRVFQALKRTGKLFAPSPDIENASFEIEHIEKMTMPSSKGVELYSVLDQSGDIKYALFLGTNRSKPAEMINAAGVSLPKLLTQFEKLAGGERIFWNIDENPDVLYQYPNADILKQIKQKAEQLGLTIVYE